MQKNKKSPWLSMVSINPLFSPQLTVDLSNHLSGFQSFHDKSIQAREYFRPRLLLFQENLIELSNVLSLKSCFLIVFCFTASELTKDLSKCDLLHFVLVLWCLVIPAQYFSISSLYVSSWLVSVIISKILNL